MDEMQVTTWSVFKDIKINACTCHTRYAKFGRWNLAAATHLNIELHVSRLIDTQVFQVIPEILIHMVISIPASCVDIL
jgi:hypothetical protein